MLKRKNSLLKTKKPLGNYKKPLSRHQRKIIRNKKILKALQAKGYIPKKPNTKIKPVTERYVSRKRVYRFLRDFYLFFNPVCEVCNKRKSTSLHHKAGRNGFNMFRFFCATCTKCHTWIHDNPGYAKEADLIIIFDGNVPLGEEEIAMEDEEKNLKN